MLLLISSVIVHGQDISISADDDHLNKILTDIRDNYNVNISFDDRQLANYKVNINKTFSSPENAIRYLLKDLPFKYELQNGVFVIYNQEIKVQQKEYQLSGKSRTRSQKSLSPTHTSASTALRWQPISWEISISDQRPTAFLPSGPATSAIMCLTPFTCHHHLQ